MAFKATIGRSTGCRALVLVWLIIKDALALAWSTKLHLQWPILLMDSFRLTLASETTGITIPQGFFSCISKEENPSQRQCAATTPQLPISIILHRIARNPSSAWLANHKRVCPLQQSCCALTSLM